MSTAGTPGGLRAELRTLAWLQRRLLVNGLRSGSRRELGRVAGLALLVVISVPYILFLGGGLLIALRTLPPERSTPLLASAFTFLSLMWALSPMANQQLLEAPSLRRLLPHPISLRGLVIGGLATSAASFIAIVTLPFLTAVLAGAARGPGSAAQIAVAGGLCLAMLVALKAVVLDMLDLAAEDRRLRQAVTAGIGLVFFGFVMSQMGLSDFGRTESTPFFDRMTGSAFLLWLPPGWFAGAVGAAMTGDAAGWALRCALLAAAAGAGAWLHGRLQARLYFGDAWHTRGAAAAAERPLRERRRLPGLSAGDSRALRALVRKDWLNLRRSPLTSRVAFLPVMFGLMAFFGTRNLAPPPAAVGLVIGGASAFITTAFAVNGLALLDHRGLGSLLLTPVRRKLVLAAQGVLFVAVATLFAATAGAGAALASGGPEAVVAAVAAAAVFQLAFAGLGHLGSVYFAHYVDIERGQAEASGTAFAGTFVILVGVPIVAAPIGAGLAACWVWAPRWLPLALLAAMAYAAVVYAGLLAWATHALSAREDRLYAEIVEGR